jgi:polyhydroxybutyrate depolymerase
MKWVHLALFLTLGACSTPDEGAADLGSDDLSSIGGDAASSDGGAADAANSDMLIAGCAPAAQAGHQKLTCGDGTAFDVESSASCVAGGCGVILDIHGYTMTGDEEDLHTRLRTLAPARGFVVVQPTAPGALPSWGLGVHPNDDTVWAFLEATVTRFNVDSKKIHVLGFSQGSMMTLRLLCAHSDRIASVAPYSGASCFVTEDGGLASAQPTGKKPVQAVPILYSHGTQDKVLPYGTVGVPLRDEIIKAWSLGAPTTLKAEPKLRASLRTGAGRALLEFWDNDYISSSGDQTFIGGHCIPGPINPGDGSLTGGKARFRCLEPGEYDFGLEALRFFEAHPR